MTAASASPSPQRHATRQGVRLRILSDLHLSQGAPVLPQVCSDIVVVAGDVARPPEAMAWLRHFAQPIVYVPGNHEYYGGSLSRRLAQLRELAAGTDVHVLDRDALVLSGVRFLGTTLWTDFRLDGDGAPRARAIAEAARVIRDFSRIESAEHPGAWFTPEESTRIFERDRAWLAQQLAEPFAGPTVIVTHHAPSARSVHPRHAGSPINAGFASDLEDLMGAQRVALWIHGHTHDSFDYVVNGTRVVCNPRGYAKGSVNENAVFDPRLAVTLY